MDADVSALFPHHIVVVRHGETEWSREGRHTGRTDIPLTDAGRDAARQLSAPLGRWSFAEVRVSPLQRARDTCSLAGYGEAIVDPNLTEWDYGAYEGMRTADVRQRHPRWNIWDDGAPNGEPLSAAADRADRVLGEIAAATGDVLLFAHGHILRILTARWLQQAAIFGRHLRLQPASPGILHHEHEWPTIDAWNLSRR